MARDLRLITDEQWKIIEPLLPEPKASPRGGPKPIANRPCFEGILWALRRGRLERAGACLVGLSDSLLV